MSETLETVDGRSVLRIERRLAHPPEKVWRAVTEPAHLRHWFPATMTFELQLGAKIDFDFGGAAPNGVGVVTELAPPRIFAFSWDGSVLRFELHPDGTGCRLVFTQTFDDRPAAASYAAGWRLCLEALAQVVAGEPVTMAGDPSGALHEHYVRALGLAGGSVEERPDGWVVRFERQLTRPAETVWAVLAGDGTPQPGGPPPAGFTASGVPAGAVTEVDAARLLAYDWPARGAAGRVRWQLGPGTGHGARLTLTQSGPAELAAESATALTAWRERIERLAAELVELPPRR